MSLSVCFTHLAAKKVSIDFRSAIVTPRETSGIGKPFFATCDRCRKAFSFSSDHRPESYATRPALPPLCFAPSLFQHSAKTPARDGKARVDASLDADP